MIEFDEIAQRLEAQAGVCYATVDSATAKRYGQEGFPLTPELKAEFESMLALAEQAAASTEVDFLQSPRGFYLYAYPLIALALVHIFTAPELAEPLPEKARKSHFARRLYGLSDDLTTLPGALDVDWSVLNDRLDNHIRHVVAATFEQHKADRLAEFYLESPEQFELIYQAGRAELIGEPA